jgi:DNA repair protein RadA/Sms
MAKTRVVHACIECGTSHPKWAGQCSGCGAWNTLVEELTAPPELSAAESPPIPSAPVQIGDVDPQIGRPQPTGIGELDRVLGGGIVPGSVTLLGGEPGIGKSTLLLQLLAW